VTPSGLEREARLAAVLGASPELAAYERWLAERRGPAAAASEARRDYLFLEDRPRFEPRRDDVCVVLPAVEVRHRGDGAALEVPSGEGRVATIAVDGVVRDDLRRALLAIDGARTLLEARWEAGLPPEVFARVLRAAFGLVVLAPRAIAALEARASCVEVVRHPSSPYAIERPYWENAADVREREIARRDALRAGGERFLRALRELHVTQLMGASLDRFYRPASPASAVAVDPGAFARDAQIVVERAGAPVALIAGLRVLAPPPLGPRAFRLLAEALGDPTAADDAGRRHEDAGLPWGRVVRGRGDGDEEPRAWFLPPRPIDERHLEALAGALGEAHDAADRGDREGAIAAAARLHARFVRLHPFRCANQSVAMALANAVVARVAGRGIPHLALDHLALRLAPEAYERAFARAVAAHGGGPAEPAARLAAARSAARAALALGDRLAAATDDGAARALVAGSPEAARAALLAE
jgi:hypothetical protein